MNEINTWWTGLSKERYWLGVTDRGCRNDLLAAPRVEGKRHTAWSQRLITHVKDGDIVFHFDGGERAILACSTARGSVHERPLLWPGEGDATQSTNSAQTRSSWAIELEQPTHLNPGVSLEEIARVQWDLFPALRSLEDRVGEPLYYPFEMGNRSATRPLPGYIFKLPAMFVDQIPALAQVAEHAGASPTTTSLRPSAQRRPSGSLVGALSRLAR